MLVAVALIVVMMTLFASIFQMATGALAQQKGLSENDQRVRLVETLLRNDLNGTKADRNNNNQPRAYRTFRILIPYGQGETIPPVDPVSHVPADPGDRLGYFAISENNPFDDTDDVLSLTVALPPSSPERYYGKAAIVFPDSNGNYGPQPNPGNQPNTYPGANYPAPAANPNGTFWLNQPEFDDYLGAINQAGSAVVAEVSYFLRHGTLYRRLLLVRSPNVTPPPVDGQPADLTGNPLPLTTYTGGGRNFWGDFDYSAFNSNNGLRFHFNLPGTLDSLSVGSQSLGSGAQVLPITLGNPAYRFGYDCFLPNPGPNPTFGQPREFDSNGYFIGRFTQSETSFVSSQSMFGYPGTYPSPMQMGTQVNYFNNDPTTGVIQQFNSGPPQFRGGYRAGEDALMTNVLKFDIKVWDPKASRGPDGWPGIAGVDDDGDGIIDQDAKGNIDVKELGAPGSDDGAFVDIGHFGQFGSYNAASSANIYFSPGVVSANNTTLVSSLDANGNTATNSWWQSPTWPINANGAWTGNGAPVSINRFDSWNPYLDLNGNGPNGLMANQSDDLPPYGPVPQSLLQQLGTKYTNNNTWPYSWYWAGFFPIGLGPDGRPGKAGFDDNGDGIIDDSGELGTAGTDDFLPLSAVQIKITFYDTTSKQLREMTFVQSLLYTP